MEHAVASLRDTDAAHERADLVIVHLVVHTRMAANVFMQSVCLLLRKSRYAREAHGRADDCRAHARLPLISHSLLLRPEPHRQAAQFIPFHPTHETMRWM